MYLMNAQRGGRLRIGLIQIKVCYFMLSAEGRMWFLVPIIFYTSYTIIALLLINKRDSIKKSETDFSP